MHRHDSSTTTSSFRWKLMTTIFFVALGSGGQTFSTDVVNNLQLVARPWLNSTLANSTGTIPQLDTYWAVACGVIDLGGIIGSLLINVLSNRLGRRRSLMLSSAMNIAGIVLSSSAKSIDSYAILCVGRFVIGVALGMGIGIAGTFLAEIAPTHLRGMCGGSLEVCMAFSETMALVAGLPALLGTETMWPVALCLPVVPALAELLWLLCVATHETPRYLYMQRHQKDQAMEAAVFYQHEVDETMIEMQGELESHEVHEIGFLELFQHRHYWLPLLLVLVVEVSVSFSGLWAILSYSTDMIIALRGTSELTAKYITVGVGGVNFAFSVLGMWLIDRIGRRPLLLVYLFGGGASLTLLSIFSSVTTDWSHLLAVSSLFLFAALSGVGGPVQSVLADEMFTTNARPLAVTIAGVVAWLIMSVSVLLYLPLKNAAGVALSFVPFIVVLFFGGVLLAVMLPETNGRSAESIVDGFRRTTEEEGCSLPAANGYGSVN